jgi:hypothetical protein
MPSLTTTAVSSLPIKTVQAKFNYFLPESQGGSRILYSPTASMYRRKFDENVVEVHDIRGTEDKFSLDVQGFQICQHGLNCSKEMFEDESVVKGRVYAETAEFLKKVYVS